MSAFVTELSDQNFDAEVLQGCHIYVVHFRAPWSPACNIIAPILDELADDYEGKVKFGKYNVDESSNMAILYKITDAPTTVIMKGGEIKERILGAVPKKTFQAAIDKNL